jgi:hypothetical protein
MDRVLTMDRGASLLFVYNADSGFFNTLADIGHKLFSPATYPCQLCAITHGVLAERGAWQDFVAALDLPSEFLHRDQFLERFPGNGTPLPAIFRLVDGEPQVCADAVAIAACTGLEDLQALIRQRCLGTSIANVQIQR